MCVYKEGYGATGSLYKYILKVQGLSSLGLPNVLFL